MKTEKEIKHALTSYKMFYDKFPDSEKVKTVIKVLSWVLEDTKPKSRTKTVVG